MAWDQSALNVYENGVAQPKLKSNMNVPSSALSLLLCVTSSLVAHVADVMPCSSLISMPKAHELTLKNYVQNLLYLVYSSQICLLNSKKHAEQQNSGIYESDITISRIFDISFFL